MRQRKITFVEARAQLSEIVDRVAEHGNTYVVAKRYKPLAVVIGVERYDSKIQSSNLLRTVWD